MAKNYNPWMLLVILLISINFSFSQTVEFNGSPNDFLPSQKITGDATVDYYVSFDATTMYFGAFRTSGTFANNDQFTIYFDTDPNPVITNGSGSTTGIETYTHTPQLPFKADRRFTVDNTVTNGKTTHFSYGSSWGSITGVFTRETSTTALEIAIPFNRINTNQFNITQGIYFSMFIARNQPNGFYGYSDPEYPISFDGSISTGFFGGIGVTSKVTNPTARTNTPILHSLFNEQPTAGGKYAYIGTDANEGFYTVNGDIELVEGGSASIGPGTGLIIEGTFTNNGVVTLKSQSDKYSSLIATSVDGIGYAKYERHVNMNSATADNDLVSTPFTGQTFGAFAADNEGRILANGTQRAFGIFNKDLAKYRNYYTDINANTILEPGVGYRAAAIPDNVISETGTAFIYTGAIETGEVSIPIRKTATAFSEWNLIGNPYPSYIDIQKLINHNKLLLDENYISVHGYAGGNTKVWEPIGLGIQFQGRVMAPGQGFFVLSNTLGGDFTFTPEMRIPSDADDFILGRPAAPVDAAGISLWITTGTKSFYTDIFFQNGATLDHDVGLDIALLDVPSFSIFSKLVENAGNRNRELDVQALPYSILNTEVRVPIGIKANQGEQLKISAINMVPNPFPLPENVEVYFEDLVAQTSTFLSTSSFNHNHHYIFTPSTNLTGEMGRFFLRFTNKSLSINNPDFDALDVFSPLNTGSLIVKGSVNEVTNLEIFDLNGRLLQTFSVQPHQSENRYEVSKLATGIYIVKLTNKTQSKIKKIQLNNKL